MFGRRRKRAKPVRVTALDTAVEVLRPRGTYVSPYDVLQAAKEFENYLTGKEG